MPALNSQSIQLAKEYWAENPHVKGGVVVLYNAEPCGWINQLRNPESWRPGCVAVDEHGNQWEAQGGTDQGGAERWEPMVIEYKAGQ